MQTFFDTPDYLIELLEESDYSTIKTLCKSNKDINRFCQNNQIAKKIISERKKEFVTDKFNYFFFKFRLLYRGIIPH